VASGDENAAQRLMPLASRSFLPLRNITGGNSASGRWLQHVKKGRPADAVDRRLTLVLQGRPAVLE
jgi:hypothetical protein